MKGIFVSIFVCLFVFQFGGMLQGMGREFFDDASEVDKASLSMPAMVYKAETDAKRIVELTLKMNYEEPGSYAYNCFKSDLEKVKDDFWSIVFEARSTLKGKYKAADKELNSMKRRFFDFMRNTSTRPERVEFEIFSDDETMTCKVSPKSDVCCDDSEHKVYRIFLSTKKYIDAEPATLLRQIEMAQEKVADIYEEQVGVHEKFNNAEELVSNLG